MDLESGRSHSSDSNDNNTCTLNSTSGDSMDTSRSGLIPMNTSGAPPSSSSQENLHSPSGSNDTTGKMNSIGFDLQCPMEDIPFWRALYDRCSWLIGLLLFQSCSSYILADNVELLQQHPAIIFYLTMLVGAGGNAGTELILINIHNMYIVYIVYIVYT
jgi:hypothetical protein